MFEYFISYIGSYVDDKSKYCVGNCNIEIDKKINSIDDIREFEKKILQLDAEAKLKSITIINYILLKERPTVQSKSCCDCKYHRNTHTSQEPCDNCFSTPGHPNWKAASNYMQHGYQPTQDLDPNKPPKTGSNVEYPDTSEKR